MIDLLKKPEEAADYFASNPDAYEAEEAAMGWLDAMQNEKPLEGEAGKAALTNYLESPEQDFNGQLQGALDQYEAFAKSQGREAFDLAPAVIKRKESSENRLHLRELGAFVKNGAANDAIFNHMLPRYGIDGDQWQRVKDEPGMKEQVMSDIIARELNPAPTIEASRLRTAFMLLGDTEATPKDILAAAPAYIEGKQRTVDTFASIPERAFAQSLADESDIEMEWLDDIDDPAAAKEASALYANELKKYRARYREFLPLLKPFMDGADEINPLDKIDDLTAIRYSNLDADQRQRFQEAFQYLANQGEDRTLSKKASPFAAFGRGFEGIVKDSSLFLLRQERRDAEAIIKTRKVFEKKGAGPRSKEEGPFDWVERDATDDEVLKAMRTVGVLEMIADMKDARNVVKPLDSSNVTMRGLNMIAGSIPHMLAFSNPISGTVAGTSYMENARTKLRNENPDLAPETLDNLSVAIGGAELAIQQIEFMTLGLGGTGKAIVSKGTLSKRLSDIIKKRGLQAIEGKAKVAGEFAKRGLTTAGLETVEEIAQEFQYDLGKAIGQNFDSQIPDARFGETMDQLIETAPELILTGLFFGMVGASGSVHSDVQLGKILRDSKNSGERYASGLSQESWERVDAADTDIEAAQTYRNEWERTTPEERTENISKANATIEGKQRQRRAKEVYEEFQNAETRAVTDEAIEWLQNYRKDTGEKDRVTRPAQMSAENFVDVTRSNEAAVISSVRASLESVGEDTSNLSDEELLSANVAGAVQIKKTLSGAAVKIAKGANVDDVIEEFSEAHARLSWQRGELVDNIEQLTADLRAVQETAGTKLIPDNFETLSESEQEIAFAEGFSTFARGYIRAEAEKKNEQIPEGIGEAFRRLLNQFAEAFRVVTQTAKAILQMQEDGSLGQDLQALADRALGLDMEFYAQRMNEQAQKEILADLEVDRVSHFVKGKLPRPDDPVIAGNRETGKEADPLRGELQDIWDALTTEDRNGNLNRSKAVAFFAPKGQGSKLDGSGGLVESLRQEGFEYETPAEMLEAVMNDIDGEVSFSIGDTKVTPNEGTRSYPTADGKTLIGPASFAIRAHHGTPHKVDQFTTAKMGTGEGAQAFGWGLYFAGDKSVASQYREKLSYRDFVNKFEFPEDIGFEDLMVQVESGAFPMDVTQFLKALEADDWLGFDYPSQAISTALNSKRLADYEASDKLREAAQFGNLYTVELKVEESELLDWDKPLSEQSEIVKKAIEEYSELNETFSEHKERDSLGQDLSRGLENSSAWGSEFDMDSWGAKTPQELASKILQSAGIKGIRYLDGNSRSEGEGSYNYVIFDDADIEILMENGEPVFEAPALPSAPSFSISPAQDAAYLSAVESGDMETAQAMVDEAAKKAGLTELFRKGSITTKGEGGFHLGTKEQAEDIEGTDEVGRFFVDVSSATREKDVSEWGDGSQLDDVTVYLNRHEGLEDEGIWDADGYPISGAELDNLTDEEVKRLNPSAADSYIVKTTNQIKSADPVTYDEAGNVIPLSERFNETRDEISFSISPAQDASYLSAVESGDMDAAQSMVDEAARAAGYDSGKFYHGTGIDFDSFEFRTEAGRQTSSAPLGFYFSNSEEVATSYISEVDNARGEVLFWDHDLSSVDEYGFAELKQFSRPYKGKVLSVFLKKGKTFKHDNKGQNWTRIAEVPKLRKRLSNLDGKTNLSTDDIVKAAFSQGYNSAEISNVVDSADFAKSKKESTTVAVKSPNQIKSADPVTYDEAGNVIPLSERFNESRDEISFSISPAKEIKEVESWKADLEKWYVALEDYQVREKEKSQEANKEAARLESALDQLPKSKELARIKKADPQKALDIKERKKRLSAELTRNKNRENREDEPPAPEPYLTPDSFAKVHHGKPYIDTSKALLFLAQELESQGYTVKKDFSNQSESRYLTVKGNGETVTVRISNHGVYSADVNIGQRPAFTRDPRDGGPSDAEYIPVSYGLSEVLKRLGEPFHKKKATTAILKNQADASKERFNESDDRISFSIAGPSAKGFAKAKKEGRTFTGLDGKERFELDASQAKWIGPDPSEKTTKKLSEVIEFPELFESYPDLREVKVHLANRANDGAGYNADWTGTGEAEFIEVGSKVDDPLLAILHEVQHAVQDREGFEQGTNSFDQNYKANPGEKEARGVEARQGLTAEQRAETPFMSQWQSFSARLPKAATELEAELNKLFTGVADKVKVGNKIKRRLELVLEDWAKGTYGGGKKQSHHERNIKAMAELEAVINALPLEIRGKAAVIDGVGQRRSAFSEMVKLKTQKEQRAFLIQTFGKVERVLEDYLVKEYRRKIKTQLKQASIGKTPSGGQRAKLSPFGQKTFDRIKEIVTLSDDELELRMQEVEKRREADEYTDDQVGFDERGLDAIEPFLTRIFGAYDQADSTRLDDALDFVRDTYSRSRKELLKKLTTKKEDREAAMARISKTMGQADAALDDELNKTSTQSIWKKLELSVLRNLSRGAGLFDILAMPTGDYSAVDPIQKSIRDAANEKHDREQATLKWINSNLLDIYGSQGAIDKALYEGNIERDGHGVTWAHERSNEEFTIPKADLEQALTDDLKTVTARSLNKEGKWEAHEIEIDADLRDILQRAWDKFQDLPIESQGRKRVLTFWHNTGKQANEAEPRREYQKLSHMKALHMKLMIERPAIRRKMFSRGYDEVTLTELNEFLPPELQELGRRMVDHLEAQGVEVAAMVEDIKNLPFPAEKKYFPAKFNSINKGSEQAIDPDGPKANRKGAEGPFLKPLQAHNAPPDIQNALDVFRVHMEETNHFLSHAKFSDQWAKMFRHRDFRTRINKAFGAETEQALIKQAELIESGFSPQGQVKNGMVDWMDGFRQRATKTVLGARLSSIFVQLSATVKLSQALRLDDLLKASVKAAVNPSSLKNAYQSPAIRRRIEAGNIIIQSGESKAIIVDRPTMARLRRSSNYPLDALRYSEGYANTVAAAAIWQHHYEKALESSPKSANSETIAKAYADEQLDIALETFAQPTQKHNLTVVGQFLESNNIAKWVFPFTSEPLNNLQNAIAIGMWGTITGKGRFDRYHSGQIFLTSWAILGIVEAVLRAALEEAGKEDDDDIGFSKFKDPGFWATQLAAGPIKFAGMGNVIYQMVADANDQKSYSSGNLVESVIGGMRKGMKLFDEEKRSELSDEEIMDHALDAVQGVMTVYGPTVILAQAASATEQGLDFYQHLGGERYLSDSDRFKGAMKDYKALDDLLPSLTGLKGEDRERAKAERLAEREKLIRDLIPPEKIPELLKAVDIPNDLSEKLRK